MFSGLSHVVLLINAFAKICKCMIEEVLFLMVNEIYTWKLKAVYLLYET